MYERSLGRSGQAVIWGKRRITIPMRAFSDAGLELGDRLSVRAEGSGRVLLERIEAAPASLQLDMNGEPERD